MTWLANLWQTYEDNVPAIGRFETNPNGREYALIPVSHTTQSAHIEVYLSPDGQFLRADVVPKEDASTLIPCTEDSANRTSAPVPHPLFDKLQYVAGDYARYCGRPQGTPYQDYLRQLQDWCNSADAHPKVQSVYTYLSQGTLMADLIRAHILQLDDQGRWIDRWNTARGEKPPLFKVLAGSQSAAFVRFGVDVPGDPENRLWRDPTVQTAFIHYYEQKQTRRDLCFVTGDYRACADKHASRIRHAGDKAKLISTNDTDGFTFRGRFQTSQEAATLSYDVSQKAHNALKWLIARQGSMAVDGKVFLVWGTKQPDLPNPFADSWDLYHDADADGEEVGDATHREFARQIRKALNGYRYQGDYQSQVNILVLDAATPGRLSIVYYRELARDPFLDRLQQWHESCCWLHQYRTDNGQRCEFWGAPATRDIARAAYGPEVSNKMVKGLLERLLPCIVDGRPVPRDIVRSAVYRASNPVGLPHGEWEKTLSIACALVNKTHEQEGFTVALDEHNTTRDYLFGRLLAIADVLERTALRESQEKRASHAIQYMNAFAQHPARTWGIIQSALQPYQAKLGPRAVSYNQLMDQVGSMINPKDFTNQPLGDIYLLGFYSQRHDLYTKKDTKNTLPESNLNTQEEED